ncbi:MAG: peptidoglycan D,D-transpeptidase FtsI family protein [Eggerthellaceae bacterium]|jgi:cell division protein FtsI (penicillin-binding protein 3)
MSGRQGSRTHRTDERSRSSFLSNAASTFLAGSESSRIAWIFVIFAGVALLFIGRLIYLQFIVADEYSQQAEDSRTVDITITPKRGTIYDRNGNVLATSVDCTTIYCNPTEITDVEGTAKKLKKILGGSMKTYREALSRENTSFAYLKRQVDNDKAEKVKKLDIAGIYFLSDSKREYPNGSIAGQIIGLCDIDGNGLTGLELYYDSILGGTEGHVTYEQGNNGVIISGTEDRTDAVDGQDIVISIDIGLQRYVENAISTGAKNLGGDSGQCVIMDGSTGEILAAASTPLLDPTNTDNIEDGATELKVVSQAFEPGSIFKSVTMLACLDAGVVTPKTKIFCPASLKADEYTISDAHERGDTTYTATQIMQYSSNVGISLCAKKLGFKKLYDYIGKFKLDEEYTGVDFPGEASGYLSNVSDWTTVQAYNVAFGQGVSVTPIQITRFYCMLANGGTSVTPHFLIEKPQSEGKVSYDSEKVVTNSKAIKQLNKMLTKVVTDGTGKAAAIEGYDVAGKTGTAEYAKSDGSGYVDGSYNLSFVGYLPNSNSDLVCFVGVTKVPADSVTTGIFKDIMTYAINRYNISPQRG